MSVSNNLSRGERILAFVLARVGRIDLKEEREKVRNIIAENVIEFGAYKAKNSESDLKVELSKIPVLGSLLAGAVYMFFNSYIECFSKRRDEVANALKNAIDDEFVELDNISGHKNALNYILSSDESEEKIISGDNTGKYLFKEKITDSKEIDNNEPEVALNLLCLGHRLAVNHKDFFMTFLEKAEVASAFYLPTNFIREKLYEALSHQKVIPHIEKSLTDKYLPEKKEKTENQKEFIKE